MSCIVFYDKVNYMIIKRRLPEYSIFGYRILNSLHSIVFAYILILFELVITPYFGFERIEYIAGLLFFFLINISIFILVINSCIRISKIDIYFLIFGIPLFIYLPFSINKIFFVLSKFNFLRNEDKKFAKFVK